MSPILTVARRELRAYFNSALAYAFIVSFLVVCGVFFFFVNGFFAANQASMRLWFGLMPIVLSVLLPALTMRLWADEKRQGTYELLRTLPFSETQLVLGKHLAVFGLIGITALASLPVPALCSLFGRFDTGVIASSYIGLVLLASASASVGQLVSALQGRDASSAGIFGGAGRYGGARRERHDFGKPSRQRGFVFGGK